MSSSIHDTTRHVATRGAILKLLKTSDGFECDIKLKYSEFKPIFLTYSMGLNEEKNRKLNMKFVWIIVFESIFVNLLIILLVVHWRL